jgi:hypothetical protein
MRVSAPITTVVSLEPVGRRIGEIGGPAKMSIFVLEKEYVVWLQLFLESSKLPSPRTHRVLR